MDLLLKLPLINYYAQLKHNAITIANYLIIVYAFFLPLSKEISNIAFSFIIILFFIDGNLKNKMQFAIKDKVIQAILLFIAIHFIWLIGTDFLSYGLDKVSNMKYFLSIILFVSIIKKEFIFKIISAFLFAMLFSEVTSYLIFFEFIEPFNNATQNNPVPFMLNHSFYSTLLAIALGMAVYSFIKKDLKTNLFFKLLTLCFSISISLNMFIIASRLGYILFASVIIAVLIIFFLKKYIFRTLAMTVILIGSMYYFAYSNLDTFQKRTDQAIQNIQKIYYQDNYNTSIGIRWGFHIFSSELLQENPIFGVGTGDHIEYVKEKINNSDYRTPKPMLNILNQGYGATLHSDYLDIFVQFGFIGLFVFLYIFYQIIHYNPNNKHLKALQILLVTVFLISALPQGMIYFSSLNKVFILLLATTLSLYQSQLPQNTSRKSV